jgi:hypothetical protein
MLRWPLPSLHRHVAGTSTPITKQVYELKQDEIDAAINKGRTQFTSLYDKHLHKVRACLGAHGARRQAAHAGVQ